MKTIKELREEVSKMDPQKIDAETLLVQTRIARACENIAFNLEKISDNIEKFKLY
jgi:hypothetical protein